MKLFTLLFFFLVTAHAQIKPVDQQYMSGENYLLNNGFESGRTNWTQTGTATATLEQSIVRFGVQSYKIVASSQTVDLSQIVTKYAAQSGGQQGIVSVFIKNTNPLLKVCAVSNSVDTNCLDVLPNDEWREYAIPFVLSATNNGIRIKSASGTGTTYIDNAFVGVMPATMMPEISQAELVGSLTMTSCNATGWANATTSYTTPVNTGCVYTASGDVLAPTTQTYGFRINNVKAGTYFIASSGAMLRQDPAATSSGASARWTDGTNTYPAGGAFLGVNQQLNTPFPQPATFTYANSASSVSIDMQLAAFVAGGGARIEPDGLAAKIVFHVYYYPPKSKIYSGDTIYPHAQLAGQSTFSATGVISTTSYTAFNGTRSPSNITQNIGTWSTTSITGYKQTVTNLPKGCYRHEWGSNQIGNTGNSDVTLCAYQSGVCNNGSESSSRTASSSGYPHQTVGYICYDSNQSSVEFELRGKVSTGNSTATNTDITFKLTYFPPKDNPIIGTFAGIEKCANDFECTDVFSAKVSSTGVVSDENLDWISGNCTNANPSVCTFNSGIFTATPNCVGSPVVNGQMQVSGTTTTTVSLATQDSSGTSASGDKRIYCQKQGSDYKPKTAKAATTNEMVRTIGTTTPVLFSAAYGTTNSTTVCSASPCSYFDQIGSYVTSITRTGAGAYSLNLNQTFQTVNCTHAPRNPAVTVWAGQSILHCKNCSSLSFSSISFSNIPTDSHGSIVCHGAL
jgi:hypothetical protein